MSDDKEFDINEALAAQGFEPIGQQEEINVENVNPNEPEREWNSEKSTFEYKNPTFRKIAELRSKLKATKRDLLKDKEDSLRRGLDDPVLGLTKNDLGKTGNSHTNETSEYEEEKYKAIAQSQLETYREENSNTHKKLQELTPSIKEGMDKSTPIKEVSSDMIFNVVASKRQHS